MNFSQSQPVTTNNTTWLPFHKRPDMSMVHTPSFGVDCGPTMVSFDLRHLLYNILSTRILFYEYIILHSQANNQIEKNTIATPWLWRLRIPAVTDNFWNKVGSGQRSKRTYPLFKIIKLTREIRAIILEVHDYGEIHHDFARKLVDFAKWTTCADIFQKFLATRKYV